MGTADLHIHTAASYDGTATVGATLEHVRCHTSLDVIAVTDHDEIDGALEAEELAPRFGVQVIPGIEISTAEGHLLALFVREIIPRGLPLIATLDKVAEAGGLAVAPHPAGRWEGCLSAASLRRALAVPTLRRVLVAGEAHNASLPWQAENRRAARAVHACKLSPVAGSDAHMLWMIGGAATQFRGRSPADLRRALEEGQTQPVVTPRPWSFLSSYLLRQALRARGFVQWAPPVPGSAISLRRLSSL